MHTEDFEELMQFAVDNYTEEEWQITSRRVYVASGLIAAAQNVKLSVFDTGVLTALCSLDSLGGSIIQFLKSRFNGESETDIAESVHRLIELGYIKFDNQNAWLDFDAEIDELQYGSH